MKKGIWSLGVVAISALMFLTVGALTASEKKSMDVPDDVMISNEGYKKDKKGPVKLTHKKHVGEYGAKCTDCHHEYKDGKNVWEEGQPVKKCADCHDPKKKQGKVLKLNLAYHKNCKNCHKKAAKEGKKEAPYKKCSGCHEKK